MEHTKRLGFIVEPYVQMASTLEYIKQINKAAKLDDGVIEIRMIITYEKGTSSRVLGIYAIEEEAEIADIAIFGVKFDKLQYASYKLSDSS